MDPSKRELRRGQSLLAIEPQVFDLLLHLIRNRDRVVSKDELINVIWHGRNVSESTIVSRINAARMAVGDSGKFQQLIRTLPRQGLRFVGEVTEVAAPPPGRSLYVRQRFNFVARDAPSIVVLPFWNIGGDLRGQHLSDELADEIITSLSRLGLFFVVSRSTSFALKEASIASRQIARRLGARYILQGSVRLIGRRAHVNAQLIDGISDRHLWADSFVRDETEALPLSDTIAEIITSFASDQIFAAEDIRLRGKSIESFGAWEHILHALTLMNSRRPRDSAKATRLLRRAIRIDPSSASAYCLLSIQATLGVHFAWHSGQNALAFALRCANAALALDGDHPWAHVAVGYAMLWQRPEAAFPSLLHSLALNPNLAFAHYLIALASTLSGRHAGIFEHANLAEHLKSRDLLAYGNAGTHNNVRATASYIIGLPHDGITYARQAIAENPRQAPAYRSLIVSCVLAGEIEQAKHELRALKLLAPTMSQQWIAANSVWARKEDQQIFVEAFRIAGLE